MTVVRVDHTAIVVADIDEAVERWTALTGCKPFTREVVDHQGVEIVMLEIGDTRIELIHPTDESSGVARFLAKRGEGLHHVGLQVDDIAGEIAELSARGFNCIDGLPRPGAHGRIVFLEPRSTGGVLVELIEHDRTEENESTEGTSV